MNFEVTRDFDCFRQTIGHISNRQYNAGCIITEVSSDHIRGAQNYCEISPSWQNSMDSIDRGASNLICLGAFIDNVMVGYCVLDTHTGDLTQIAVQRDYRRQGIASRLLHEAVIRMKTDFIKVLNINSDYHPMLAFLESKNIHLASRQFEMILPLQSTR